MHSFIDEAEERLERKIAQHTGRKVMEVHQCLDNFEMWVLTRPAPIVSVTSLQAAMESVRVVLDTILESRVPESEAPFDEPAE